MLFRSITVGQNKDDGGRWPYAGTAGAVVEMGAKHVNRDVLISFCQKSVPLSLFDACHPS